MPLLTSSPRTARSDTHIVAAQCTHDVSSAQEEAASQAESAEAETEASTTLLNGTLHLFFSAGVKLPSRKRRRNIQGGAARDGEGRGRRVRSQQQDSQQTQQHETSDENDVPQASEQLLTAGELLASGVWSLTMDFLRSNSQQLCLRDAQVVQPSMSTVSNEVEVLLVSDQSASQDSSEISAPSPMQVLHGIRIHLLFACKGASRTSEALHSTVSCATLPVALQKLFCALLPRLFAKELVVRYGRLFNGPYVQRSRALANPLASLATSLSALALRAAERKPHGEHAQLLKKLRSRAGVIVEEELQPLPRRRLPPVRQREHVRAASMRPPSLETSSFARAATGPVRQESQVGKSMSHELARAVVLRSLREVDQKMYPPQKIKVRLQPPSTLPTHAVASTSADHPDEEAEPMDFDESDAEASDAEVERLAQSSLSHSRGDMPDFIEPLRPSEALLARMAGRGTRSNVQNGSGRERLDTSSLAPQPRGAQALSSNSSPLSSLSGSQTHARPAQPPLVSPLQPSELDVLLEDLIWSSDEEQARASRPAQQRQPQRAQLQRDALEQRLTPINTFDMPIEDLIWTSEEEEATLQQRFIGQLGQQQQVQGSQLSANSFHQRPIQSWNEIELDEQLVWSSDEEKTSKSLQRIAQAQPNEENGSTYVDPLDVPLDELTWPDEASSRAQAFVDTHDALMLDGDDIDTILSMEATLEQVTEFDFDFEDEEDEKEFERALRLHWRDTSFEDGEEDLLEWD